MRQLLRWFALVITLVLCVSSREGDAQANASALLAQLSQAISGGKPINSVTLQGTAVWYAGSTQDSGPITLTASSAGTDQIQLTLSKLGNRTESQAGLGSSQTCSWSGADGVSHEMSLRDCWKPLVAFFPAISLQPTFMPTSLGVSDLGTGTVGSGTYRHLQAEFVFSNVAASQLTDLMKGSTTDVGLDPTTLLPAILAYSVNADVGSSTPVAIEVHYANYTAINGVDFPFSIQRYVNGSLQLDITITSAQSN